MKKFKELTITELLILAFCVLTPIITGLGLVFIPRTFSKLQLMFTGFLICLAGGLPGYKTLVKTKIGHEAGKI